MCDTLHKDTLLKFLEVGWGWEVGRLGGTPLTTMEVLILSGPETDPDQFVS